MGQGRFITYQPTSLRVINGRSTEASVESIRSDLAVLRPRFDSLITYGALHGADAIPKIAAALHYRALVIGVWNPFNDAEVDAALAAAHQSPELVVGIMVGNEWLFAQRPRGAELAARLVEIRTRASELPIATSEPFHMLYPDSARALLAELDFLLPNVHPVYQPWFRQAPSENAAAFVVGVADRLRDRFCGPILIKETGVPTAPAESGFSVERQAGFYRALAAALAPSGARAFAYFDAFDAPWRVADEQASPGYHPEEAHWGLYDAGRIAKPVVASIPLLAVRR
jgi:exo-beta-1,3-glucanase (GH17 family)